MLVVSTFEIIFRVGFVSASSIGIFWFRSELELLDVGYNDVAVIEGRGGNG